MKSSPLLNNRREQRAYITHLDRSEKERERKRKKENENTNTDADKKYITNFDRKRIQIQMKIKKYITNFDRK